MDYGHGGYGDQYEAEEVNPHLAQYQSFKRQEAQHHDQPQQGSNPYSDEAQAQVYSKAAQAQREEYQQMYPQSAEPREQQQQQHHHHQQQHPPPPPPRQQQHYGYDNYNWWEGQQQQQYGKGKNWKGGKSGKGGKGGKGWKGKGGKDGYQQQQQLQQQHYGTGAGWGLEEYAQPQPRLEEYGNPVVQPAKVVVEEEKPVEEEEGVVKRTIHMVRSQGQKLGMDFHGTTVTKTWEKMIAHKAGIRQGMRVYAVNGKIVKNLGEVKDAFGNAGTNVAVTIIEPKRVPGDDPPLDIKCVWVTGIPPSMTNEDAKALFTRHGPLVGAWKCENTYIAEYTTKKASMAAMLTLDEVGILENNLTPVTCEYKLVPKDLVGNNQPQEKDNSPTATTVDEPQGDSEQPSDEAYWAKRGSENPVRAAGLYKSMLKDVKNRVYGRGIVPKSTQNVEKTKQVTMYPLPPTWVAEVVVEFVGFASMACGLSVPSTKSVTVYRGKGLIDGCEYNIAEVETNLPVEAAQIVGCTNGFNALPKESDHDDIDDVMALVGQTGLQTTLGFNPSLEKSHETLTIDIGDDAKYRLAPDRKLPCRFHCVYGNCFIEACPKSHDFPAGEPNTFYKKAIRIDNLPSKLTMDGITTMVRGCVGADNIRDILWFDHFRLQAGGTAMSDYSCVLQIWKTARLKPLIELLQKRSMKDQKGSPLKIMQLTALSPIIGRPVEPGDPDKPYDSMVSKARASKKRKDIDKPIHKPAPQPFADKERQMAVQLEALKEANKKLWETNVTLMTKVQTSSATSMPPPKKHKNMTWKAEDAVQQPTTAQPVARSVEVTMAVERCPLCGLRGHTGADCPKAAQLDTLEVRNIRKELEEARGKRAGYMKALVANPTSKKTQMKIVDNNTRISHLEKRLTEKMAHIPVAEPVKRPNLPPSTHNPPSRPAPRPSKLNRLATERLKRCTSAAMRQLAADHSVNLEGCIDRMDILAVLAAEGVAPAAAIVQRPVVVKAPKAPIPVVLPVAQPVAMPPPAAQPVAMAKAAPAPAPAPAPPVDDDDEDYMPTAVAMPLATAAPKNPPMPKVPPPAAAPVYTPQPLEDDDAYVPMSAGNAPPPASGPPLPAGPPPSYGYATTIGGGPVNTFGARVTVAAPPPKLSKSQKRSRCRQRRDARLGGK